MSAGDDATLGHSAVWGECRACGGRDRWLVRGLDLCMACRFKPTLRTLAVRISALPEQAQRRLGGEGDWRARTKRALLKNRAWLVKALEREELEAYRRGGSGQ